MASLKQIAFIEKLMKEREIGDLDEAMEARTIRAGMGDELSIAQASRFIEALLECPKAEAEPNISQEKIGEKVDHSKYGEGTIIGTGTDRAGEFYAIKFFCGVKKILIGYVDIK